MVAGPKGQRWREGGTECDPYGLLPGSVLVETIDPQSTAPPQSQGCVCVCVGVWVCVGVCGGEGGGEGVGERESSLVSSYMHVIGVAHGLAER